MKQMAKSKFKEMKRIIDIYFFNLSQIPVKENEKGTNSHFGFQRD